MKRSAALGLSVVALLLACSCGSDRMMSARFQYPPAVSDTVGNAIYTYAITKIETASRNTGGGIHGYDVKVRFENNGDHGKYFYLMSMMTPCGVKSATHLSIASAVAYYPTFVGPHSSATGNFFVPCENGPEEGMPVRVGQRLASDSTFTHNPLAR